MTTIPTITALNEQLAFAGQILPSDLKTLAEQGYQQLVCHRPDDEESGQPAITELQQTAEQLGISISYAPVADGQFTQTVLNTTQTALQRGQKTLLFCRSGRRSCIVWAMLQIQQGENIDKILQQTAAIGYDISDIIYDNI